MRLPAERRFPRELTSRHLGAGWFLIRLRNTALLRLDVSRMGEVLSNIAATGLQDTGTVLDGDYIYILDHSLKAWQREAVERICWRYKDRPITSTWLRQNRTTIQESFDALVEIVDRLLNPEPPPEIPLDI